MNDTVETEIVKASAPVISAIVEKGMKELAETTQKLAAMGEKLAEAHRVIAEKDDQLAARDSELARAQAAFDAFRDKQELILWGCSFVIIILLAIMITSVRQGGYPVAA
jgi:hypothetical protein